ncbi:MAG: NADH-ubiquinone oxidoreductase [Clostridia bacterium]|nr:NADH-ubiquinone oxidoreductase [Clostridia bacterium]
MLNPVLTIAIPLGLSFLSVILKKKRGWVLLAAACANVVMLFFLEKGEVVIGGFRAPFGINLILDAYALAGMAVAGTLFLAAVLVSRDKAERFSTVLLAALAGINGMLLTGDLFNLFVFMEITAISAYLLSSAGKKPEHSFNYLVLGSVGSVFYLLGLILLYSMTGTLNMAEMSRLAGSMEPAALAVPVFLIFTGIAVEAKLIPAGGWVRGVLGNSDSLTGALFASVYSGAALFVFGRIFADVLLSEGAVQIVLILLGLLTFAFGEAAAFRQTSIRRILLYSSIGQSGLAAMLFATGLIFPAVLVIISNSVSKFVMFTTAGKITEIHGTDDYRELGGLFRGNRLIGTAFTISALSLTGIPLLFGFYAKLNVLAAYFNGRNYFLPAVILILAMVEGAYFIRLLIRLWTPGKEGEEPDAGAATKGTGLFKPVGAAVVFILSMAILAAGLLPDHAGEFISSDGGLPGGDAPSINLSLTKGGQ